MDYLFIEYHVTLIDNLDHPALIKEWKQNLYAADHEKIKPRCKATSKEEKY